MNNRTLDFSSGSLFKVEDSSIELPVKCGKHCTAEHMINRETERCIKWVMFDDEILNA